MKNVGKCSKCGRTLLLNPENKLCVICELAWYKEKLIESELIIAQCRRERQSLYSKLSNERIQGMGKA